MKNERAYELATHILEQWRKEKGLSGLQAHKLFKEQGVLDYIISQWEVIHTFGTDYMIGIVDEFLEHHKSISRNSAPMKLKFKHQKFQEDAALAVCNVFKGQPLQTEAEGLYQIDQGVKPEPLIIPGEEEIVLFEKTNTSEEDDFTGWRNASISGNLAADGGARLLENIRKVQINATNIKPDAKLQGPGLNLTVEMETGVGKTYTYIKTMFELNLQYGWSKFIIVVPSIAIREGVNKSLQMLQDHFFEDYGKKVRFFIYNSARLSDIQNFAHGNGINVMIINAGAFNRTDSNTLRIDRELDEFNSRKPIDVIAKTKPILIVDEPQLLEGAATKTRMKSFNPLFTVGYSATYKNTYNQVYRLDAIDAYNKRLVKKIAVRGVSIENDGGFSGYLYLEAVNISKNQPPTVTIEVDVKLSNGSITKKRMIVRKGENIYSRSKNLEQYKDNWIIADIVATLDESANYLELVNGERISVGEAVGNINEDLQKRLQIRETIKAHLEKEKTLYKSGIKCLSLFFIDEVAKYRKYKADGEAETGEYAQIFQDEYLDLVRNLANDTDSSQEYLEYLQKFAADKVHNGYFSIDKIGRVKNTKGESKDDESTYDLIMKDKEKLLSFNEPTRFIFSHSALSAGWDNPNVFQICTLKNSAAEIRKRQEVGRGLRLCVNNFGERQDEEALGSRVQEINKLTVITNESYELFTRDLQKEIADATEGRISKINPEFFLNKLLTSEIGVAKLVLDEDKSQGICDDLIRKGYISKGKLTETYFADRDTASIEISEEVPEDYKNSFIELLESAFMKVQIENDHKIDVKAKLNQEKLESAEFQELWRRIQKKSHYTVSFDSAELVKNAVKEINASLSVSTMQAVVAKGEQTNEVIDRDVLLQADGFKSGGIDRKNIDDHSRIQYDLIGKIEEQTKLTRVDIVSILENISSEKFGLYKINPEEFIAKTSKIISDALATEIVERITYNKLDQNFETEIFTEAKLSGQIGKNAQEAKKSLFDFVITDSKTELEFAAGLDQENDVKIYVKLPGGFYIDTPFGKYNPDWAIVFDEVNTDIRNVYFVAETKGSMSTLDLRVAENAKIECARRHFAAISQGSVRYDVVDSVASLRELLG